MSENYFYEAIEQLEKKLEKNDKQLRKMKVVISVLINEIFHNEDAKDLVERMLVTEPEEV